MTDFLKGILVAVLVILYVIAPDFFPGPIDDLIVIIVGIAKTIGNHNNTKIMEG